MAEAAFSLDEAEAWATRHAAPFDAAAHSAAAPPLFASAAFAKSDPQSGTATETRLSPSRAYSLALAPQIIHSRSELVSQLVSSRAFRQLEFLAVGAFHVFDPASCTLARVPSTREDVFATTSIPARSKRALIKFLKFVLEHDTEPNLSAWLPHSDVELAAFLAGPEAGFRLDQDLRAYIVSMTLTTDGRVSVADGLRVLHTHLTSMGMFGPGFAAVYPKWGGSSEIAQMACRAGAVGGAVYMLGTGVRDFKSAGAESGVQVTLADGLDLQTKLLVRSSERVETAPDALPPPAARLTVVVDDPLPSLFEAVVEGSPTPAVAIVAFPQHTLADDDGNKFPFPIYALAHSSETGECPAGQSESPRRCPLTASMMSLLFNSLSTLSEHYMSTTLL